ncbi:MAG: AAA family ATPase [Candidatus Paceibacteria bacterium]
MAKNLVLCGSHGTGKSTLVDALSKMYEIAPVQHVARSYWDEIGVYRFEYLPPSIRSITQKDLLLRQIAREDELMDQGFITERSVLDVLAYTYVSSDMRDSDWHLFEQLVKERVKYYTYVIYTPIEFQVNPQHNRASSALQQDIADIIERYLEQWHIPHLRVTGNVRERIGQIEDYLK